MNHNENNNSNNFPTLVIRYTLILVNTTSTNNTHESQRPQPLWHRGARSLPWRRPLSARSTEFLSAHLAVTVPPASLRACAGRSPRGGGAGEGAGPARAPPPRNRAREGARAGRWLKRRAEAGAARTAVARGGRPTCLPRVWP